MHTLLFILLATVSVFGQSVTTGKQLWEQKKYAEARKQLLAIKKDSKDYAVAQYYLGRVAFDEKKYDEAEAFLKLPLMPTIKWPTIIYGMATRWAPLLPMPIYLSKLRSAPK